MTPSPAAAATTWRCSATATICSSGIPATAATWSRVGAGTDTLQFNGSNVGEHIDISANGGRATLFRDVGAVTMDLNSVERIRIAASGGADTVTVNDLTGSGVRQVAVDLAAAGTGSGDGQADTVVVNGTAGDNRISIASSGASVTVRGLSAQVIIDHAEGADDSLVVNGLDGNDTINASALDAGQIRLTINGGAGNDTIHPVMAEISCSVATATIP